MKDKKAQPAHLETGKTGEEEAARYLCGQGFALLERNWRPAAGQEARLELDIIARDKDGGLVFVEVKTRSFHPSASFSPLDAFGKAKQNSLFKAASLYLNEHEAWNLPCRFDLITVIIHPDNTCKLEHLKNVISFPSPSGGAMDYRHSPWQPW